MALEGKVGYEISLQVMNGIIVKIITLFVDYDNLPICDKVFCFKFTYCVKNYLSLTRLKGKLRYLPPFKGDRSYVAQGRGSCICIKMCIL